MDPLEKMTKTQLLEQINLLEQKVASQMYLATAVDAKDREISGLIQTIKTLEAKVESQKHLADAVDAKDRELSDLRKAKQVNDSEENGNLKLQLEHERNINKRLADMLDSYVEATRAYLKTSQGSLDNMLLLDAYIIPKIEPNKGG